jgi:hypothetical protein
MGAAAEKRVLFILINIFSKMHIKKTHLSESFLYASVIY